jgi:hypothetical protein
MGVSHRFSFVISIDCRTDWLRREKRGTTPYASPPLFTKDQIPSAFLADVSHMMGYFCDHQVATIEGNLRECSFGDFDGTHRRKRLDRQRIAGDYLERCGLRPIPGHMYLVGAKELVSISRIGQCFTCKVFLTIFQLWM